MNRENIFKKIGNPLIRKNLKRFTLLVCVVFFSCNTMADYNFTQIQKNLSLGNYKLVLQELELNESEIYGQKDEVLILLDKGVLSHFNSDYTESNVFLSNAEKLIDKYRAKSISQAVTSSVINDTVKDYAGEDFEDIYSNIFMSLNYLALGKYDDAMVEVRRFDNKLKNLKLKYKKELAEVNKSNKDVKVKEISVKFHDSAFARYLSLLMYRSQGDKDNARIDYKYIKKAFETQPTLYNFDMPKSLEQEFNIPPFMARVNFIVFSGSSPIKKEEIVRAYWGPETWYKLALPTMQKRPSVINSIIVTLRNTTTGELTTQKLELIESIENIVLDTFQQNYSVLYAKALIRSISRAVSTSMLNELSKEAQNQNMYATGLILSVLDMASMVTTEVVERADVRVSRYFPSKVSVGGINILPGDYDVTIKYNSGASSIYSETKRITIKSNQLNLIESCCLK